MFWSASLQEGNLSYQELGQHTLCTSEGCRRKRRLQHKQHTHECILLFPFSKHPQTCIDLTSMPQMSYQACAPCGSCNCPPGSASRSLCGRRWCCKCQRSLNPWASPYSLPRAEEDIWAVMTTNTSSLHKSNETFRSREWSSLKYEED